MKNQLKATRLACLALLLLAVPSVANGFSESNDARPLSEKVAGELPEFGTEATAEPGAAIYARFQYSARVVARLKQPVEFKKKKQKWVIEPGELLDGFLIEDSPNARVFCSRTAAVTTGQGHFWEDEEQICIEDVTGDGKADFFRLLDDGDEFGGRLAGILGGAAYSVGRDEASPEDAIGDYHRSEVVYQGAGGGILRLQYREFANDRVRPAFDQEFTFDVDAEGPTIAVIKGARFEVLDAGNEGIRYRVVRGFE